MGGQARYPAEMPGPYPGREFIDQLLVSGFGHHSVYS